MPNGSERRRAAEAVLSILALVGVSLGAALFAHAFREASFLALRTVLGSDDPTEAARRHPATTLAVVAVATAAAAVIGHWTTHRHEERLGLTALAATATTGARPPGLRATLTRAAGTWIASSSMVSVGRESAILEAGGTLGARIPARTARQRGALTAAGLGAAFTAAYHAPIAAALYVQEHLGRGRGRTATS
ncbi:MAG: chloride channel protein, partial [Actinomycetota bacterium]